MQEVWGRGAVGKGLTGDEDEGVEWGLCCAGGEGLPHCMAGSSTEEGKGAGG
jgi:hypothetical protein